MFKLTLTNTCKDKYLNKNQYNNFFQKNTKKNFDTLKSEYEKFIIENTPINGKTEVRRIFTKMINPLSFKRKKHATKGGHFSKDIIKKTHGINSEVQDEFANGEATQIHHIFMKSQYPEISSYLENLILLTATQHFTKAHPNNNTSLIDKDYQLISLLAKSESVRKYDTVYSKEDFLYVIKIGLDYEFQHEIEFKQIQSKLIELYND